MCRHLKKLIVKWTGRLIRKSGRVLFFVTPLCYRIWPFSISSKPCLSFHLFCYLLRWGLKQFFHVCVLCRDITKTFPNFVFYTIVTDNPSSGWSWGMWFWIFVGASWFFFFFFFWQQRWYNIVFWKLVSYLTSTLILFVSETWPFWFILKQYSNWQTLEPKLNRN